MPPHEDCSGIRVDGDGWVGGRLWNLAAIHLSYSVEAMQAAVLRGCLADITGVYKTCGGDGFLWQEVRLFRKRDSECEHDYWCAEASGACLASGAGYSSGRYDPETGLLQLTRARGNREWLVLPRSHDLDVALLLGQQALQYVLKERPTFMTEFTADEHTKAFVRECARYAYDVLQSDGEHPRSTDSLLLPFDLPHGGVFEPALLCRKEVAQPSPSVTTRLLM